MRTSQSRRRVVIAGAALAVAAGAAVGDAALGTPPAGTVTATTLADVKTADTANMNRNKIRFRTNKSVEIAHISNTGAAPGWAAGWHRHTGPVLIAVTAGTLTFYDRSGRNGKACRVTKVTAPGGYIETAGQPIQVRNEGTAPASWITTQIIPVGGSKREDVAKGFCGV
jgi:hypothetical protein